MTSFDDWVEAPKRGKEFCPFCFTELDKFHRSVTDDGDENIRCLKCGNDFPVTEVLDQMNAIVATGGLASTQCSRRS